ncbi:Mu-crystallin [Phaffia rhodozyma]|uniref:Mu-crystallin n=1 Tax=Phaffia rhodozyma TaxID=264483 RepID=A0A0F7SEQ0_PHARH|nr:Mu-crystallin [Phaffia rhodozyma]
MTELKPILSSDWETISSHDSKPAASSTLPVSSKPTSKITFLSSKDVDQILLSLSLSDFLSSQSDAFQAFSSSSPSNSNDDVQTPARLALSLPNHTTLFMPSRASALGGTACKIVSVPKEGKDNGQGLPASNVLLDEDTGEVSAVIGAGQLTGVRTAAGSAVVSQMLLGEGLGREKMVVFGTGVQAFWHTHFHLLLFPSIKHVAFLARPGSTEPNDRLKKLISDIRDLHPNVQLEHSSTENYDRGQAVHNANIILCCTPSTAPLFPSTQPQTGTHISLIGSYKPFMLEVEPSLLSTRAGIVFVDGEKETKIEAGELQGFEGQVCEVGSVLKTPGKGRELWEQTKGDLTVWKSVGLATQDVAISNLVFRRGKELGLGVEVDR